MNIRPRACLPSSAFPFPKAAWPRARPRPQAAARALGGDLWVVKAQVHAGGRGKARRREAVPHAGGSGRRRRRVLGHRLVDPPDRRRGPADRTGAGRAAAEDRARALSRPAGGPRPRALVFIGSAAGGMDIEEVAAHDAGEDPDRRGASRRGLSRTSRAGGWPSRFGLDRRSSRNVLSNWRGHSTRSRSHNDASLIEINPLIVTEEGDMLALDAKLNIDDNALFRQPAAGGDARSGQEDRDRGRGRRARAELRRARRQHRLHGQRRGPGDGDDGPDPAARRRAGQLPRRRRRRHDRAGDARRSS